MTNRRKKLKKSKTRKSKIRRQRRIREKEDPSNLILAKDKRNPTNSIHQRLTKNWGRVERTTSVKVEWVIEVTEQLISLQQKKFSNKFKINRRKTKISKLTLVPTKLQKSRSSNRVPLLPVVLLENLQTISLTLTPRKASLQLSRMSQCSITMISSGSRKSWTFVRTLTRLHQRH